MKREKRPEASHVLLPENLAQLKSLLHRYGSHIEHANYSIMASFRSSLIVRNLIKHETLKDTFFISKVFARRGYSLKMK